MKNDLKHKLYMGFRGFMVRIPPLLSDKGARKGEKGAKANAACLSKEERRVHHFIVMKMAVVKDPITVDLIAGQLGMPNDQVIKIINKLESLKTFIYRDDGKGINWAYPLSLENTGFRMTASSGEQFFAAWGADAFAAPFVYGKLTKKELSFTIQAECANSGRQIEIALDSELNIKNVTDGSDPMFCLPIVPLANTKELSIVDVFWRKSLLFWSEEDVREYKKKERDLRVYMNLSKRALAGVKRMQTSIFGFWWSKNSEFYFGYLIISFGFKNRGRPWLFELMVSSVFPWGNPTWISPEASFVQPCSQLEIIPAITNRKVEAQGARRKAQGIEHGAWGSNCELRIWNWGIKGFRNWGLGNFLLTAES